MKKCKEKCEVYSRVCGYFRPVSNWHKGKKEEFKDRKTYDDMDGEPHASTKSTKANNTTNNQK